MRVWAYSRHWVTGHGLTPDVTLIHGCHAIRGSSSFKVFWKWNSYAIVFCCVVWWGRLFVRRMSWCLWEPINVWELHTRSNDMRGDYNRDVTPYQLYQEGGKSQDCSFNKTKALYIYINNIVDKTTKQENIECDNNIYTCLLHSQHSRHNIASNSCPSGHYVQINLDIVFYPIQKTRQLSKLAPSLTTVLPAHYSPKSITRTINPITVVAN